MSDLIPSNGGFDLPATANGGLVKTDPSAIAAAEHAAKTLQMAYFMAAQRPRDERAAWERVLTSCRRPAFAERAIYSKPVGNTKICGPSIRLAEEIIRKWGNILSKVSVVFEDEKSRRVSVQVIDLETNNQYSKDIVTSKTVERRSGKGREIISERTNSYGDKVYIVRATDEELHVKEAAAVSKAIRNEGLRLIPSDVVDDAIDECRRTQATRDAKDPARAIKALVYNFGNVGVKVAELVDYIGCPLEQATPDQINDLRAIRRAIVDGETTWGDVKGERKADRDSVNTVIDGKATGDSVREKLAAVMLAKKAQKEEVQNDDGE